MEGVFCQMPVNDTSQVKLLSFVTKLSVLHRLINVVTSVNPLHQQNALYSMHMKNPKPCTFCEMVLQFKGHIMMNKQNKMTGN